MAASEPEQLGLRERKKQDALARMRAAARELMWDRGYEAVGLAVRRETALYVFER